MLDDPVVQDLPPRLALGVLVVLLDVARHARRPRRPEHLRPPQALAVQVLDVGPPPQLRVDEALDEVAAGVHERAVQQLSMRRTTLEGEGRDALGLLHLLEPVVLVHPVQEVALLVVVRREDEEVDDVAQDGRRRLGALGDRRRLVDGAVVLGDLEVLLGPQAVQDHEGVVAQLEVLRGDEGGQLEVVVDKMSKTRGKRSAPRAPCRRAT